MLMLQTDRLLLRPVHREDMDVYRQILSCPQLTRFLPKGKPYTESEISQHVVNRVDHWRRHEFGSFVILDNTDAQRKLGYVGVEESPQPGCFDIRYALVRDALGLGLALEAAQSVVQFIFSHNKLKRIYGVSLVDNQPSLAVLRKLAMKPARNVDLYGDRSLITLVLEQPER
ncbi:GNAT family N-acetyltransferase [Vibrio proteolyticus]